MLTRMNRIIAIDPRNRMAVVEAGTTNLRLAQALAGSGCHFAPDPSSQGASTIGGNVATNAGGPHTLKYGVTVNHVLGLEAVLADGSIVAARPGRRPGRPGPDRPAGRQRRDAGHRHQGLGPPDARSAGPPHAPGGVRLARRPRRRVSRIIAAGIIPAALELMDRGILAPWTRPSSSAFRPRPAPC